MMTAARRDPTEAERQAIEKLLAEVGWRCKDGRYWSHPSRHSGDKTFWEAVKAFATDHQVTVDILPPVESGYDRYSVGLDDGESIELVDTFSTADEAERYAEQLGHWFGCGWRYAT